MTTEELKILISSVELKEISFDGYEFELEFFNGICVTVGKSTEYGIPIWEIESSIGKEK